MNEIDNTPYDYLAIINDPLTKLTQKIDLTKAVKLLQIDEEILRRKLFRNFKKDTDYAKDDNKIIVTLDTFKELCMMSNTDKGNQIRKYSIAIEKLLIKNIGKEMMLKELNKISEDTKKSSRKNTKRLPKKITKKKIQKEF